jgi:hypothetical protein
MELAGLEPATSWVRRRTDVQWSSCGLIKRYEALSVLSDSLSLVARLVEPSLGRTLSRTPLQALVAVS